MGHEGYKGVMGVFRSRGPARKVGSLTVLLSMAGILRTEGLKAADVASQINPRVGTGAGYLGQEVALQSMNQCKIPSQQLSNVSMDSVVTEMGLLGHLTSGEHLGNSLRVHLEQHAWEITVTVNVQHTYPTFWSWLMADIANPSPHSYGILPTVFPTVTANVSEFTQGWNIMAIAGRRASAEGGAKKCISTILALLESQG